MRHGQGNLLGAALLDSDPADTATLDQWLRAAVPATAADDVFFA